jgi:hypothetical protein
LGHESLEAGWSGPGRAVAGQPHTYPHKVDRRRRQDVLEMGFRRTSLAGASDPKGTDGLGDGPFNASAFGILGCVCLGLLTLPGGL